MIAVAQGKQTPHAAHMIYAWQRIMPDNPVVLLALAVAMTIAVMSVPAQGQQCTYLDGKLERSLAASSVGLNFASKFIRNQA